MTEEKVGNERVRTVFRGNDRESIRSESGLRGRSTLQEGGVPDSERVREVCYDVRRGRGTEVCGWSTQGKVEKRRKHM